MKKLAIIGASYLQEPLITKAKNMGIETHVFAWAAGDRGERIADYFYPISIRERDQILEECRRIGIDGIVSIASDLAMETVNYIAEKMGLPGGKKTKTGYSTAADVLEKLAPSYPIVRRVMYSSASDWFSMPPQAIRMPFFSTISVWPPVIT